MNCQQPLLQLGWSNDDLPQAVAEACLSTGQTLATAESCTGGLIAAGLVSVPGISSIFPGGIVSYANEIKRDVLGVDAEVLETFGAVSKETALEMVTAARKRFRTTAAIATTGIAGPDGGTPEKPVGLVYIATAAEGRRTRITRHHFSGDRAAVRRQATAEALWQFLRLLY